MPYPKNHQNDTGQAETTKSQVSCIPVGIPENKEIKLALLHAEALRKQGKSYAAILDLKADMTWSREISSPKRLKKVLDKRIAEMVMPFVEPSYIQTDDGEWFTIDNGVAQSSHLSPSLYNIFIATFAIELDSIPKEVSKEPCKLFANDVTLTATSAKGLQELLDMASKCAQENEISGARRKASSCGQGLLQDIIFN